MPADYIHASRIFELFVHLCSYVRKTTAKRRNVIVESLETNGEVGGIQARFLIKK